LAELIVEFAEFFKEEALLKSLESWTLNWDNLAEFENDGKKAQISLSL
jgi:hypothetical protein